VLHIALRTGTPRVVNGIAPRTAWFARKPRFLSPVRKNWSAVVRVLAGSDYFQKDMCRAARALAMGHPSPWRVCTAKPAPHQARCGRPESDPEPDRSGAALEVIFTTLAQFVEAQSDGGLCSLVALDPNGARNCLAVAPRCQLDSIGRR